MSTLFAKPDDPHHSEFVFCLCEAPCPNPIMCGLGKWRYGSRPIGRSNFGEGTPANPAPHRPKPTTESIVPTLLALCGGIQQLVDAQVACNTFQSSMDPGTLIVGEWAINGYSAVPCGFDDEVPIGCLPKEFIHDSRLNASH